MSSITMPTAARARAAAGWLRATPFALFWLLIAAILLVPIVLFLAVAISPRLFEQGPQWFTLSSFQAAFQAQMLQGIADTLLIGSVTAVLSAAIGFAVAWVVQRTNVFGRRLWSGSMFALLLAPSYLVSLGWERLLEPMGVLDTLHVPDSFARSLLFGPVGVIGVLTVKGIPFAYLAVSAALRGLGEEFEAAVRVHGGGRVEVVKTVLALIAPAIWSSLAIVFAESISDYGVASTLANDAHFPIATFELENAVGNFPVQFPVAAAVSWILLAMAGLALYAQHRALRGRSYRVLGGRTRPARRRSLSRLGSLGVFGAMSLLFLLCLGVPTFGAIAASLMQGLGTLTGGAGFSLDNYRRALSSPALFQPLQYSALLATITATVTVLIALVVARLLTSRRGTTSAKMLDMLLLTAVALPGIVFAAGYIFTYNLPFVNNAGIHLYETTTLLTLAYIATSLPPASRVLFGSVGQVQESLREAARVHGASAPGSWLRVMLPLLARPLLSAWSLTFGGTLLELPVSQLLYPPNNPTVSVGIENALSKYDYSGGTAMEVVAVLFALAVIGVVWGIFQLAAPAGWRRLGRTS